MKREYVAAVMLAAILALSLINVRHIERKASALTGDIEQAQRLYQNGEHEQAADSVEDSLSSWLNWDSYSHIMLRHSEIDLVTDAYYELLSELQGENEVTEASFGALIEKLHDIVRKERVNAGSLL